MLAGGSDLLVRMKGGFIEPDLVVDIKRIKAMREIKKTATGFTIGAAVPCAELGENKALVKAWPGVVEAANLIGSKQVQGRCTITGNLCNASPAADSVPALVAAGAKAVIQGPKGKRVVPVEQVPVGPGKTSLKKGELIESIQLPARKPRSGDAYLRFIPRTEMDIAVVSAGVNLTLDAKGVVTDARVSLGRRRSHRAAGSGRRQGADRHASSMTPRWRSSAPPHPPPAARSTTSAAPSNSEPRLPPCWRSAPRRSPMRAQEVSDYGRFSYRQPSTATTSSSPASRMRPCSTCCAIAWA